MFQINKIIIASHRNANHVNWAVLTTFFRISLHLHRSKDCKGLATMSKDSLKQSRTFLSSLQEDWRVMLNDDKSKDLVLLIGANRDKLPIHKMILQARCDKFRGAKLEGNELDLPQLDTAAMRKVRQYLYTAEVSLHA